MRCCVYLKLVTAVLLVGCASRVPQVLTPEVVPSTFSGQVVGSSEVWPRADWWNEFGSPELAALIARAKADNPDLAAAEARVLEAWAQTTVQRSGLFPQLALEAQAQRGSGSGSQSGGTQSSSTSNAFDSQITATYGLDIWGSKRAAIRAASENLKSARFAQQAVALTLTSNVATTYFRVLTLRERAAIVKEDTAAIDNLLQVIELRVATGTSSHLDLAREQAQVEAVAAQLPVLQEQELEARIALALLLGRRPEAFDVIAQGAQAIHSPVVQPGLTSDLLLRRPDVAQAEASLASAHADLDAARAAFLPQFSLTGNGGYASTTLSALIRGSSFVWSAGAGVIQTIFQGGKLIGAKRLAMARQQELIASYQGAVLNAYADVESALGQVTYNQTAEEHLRHEVDAAREAFAIAQLQYTQGAADLLTVLQAQQTLFAARDQLAQTTLARLQAVVHLYTALGGGWVESARDRTQFAAK